MDVMEAHAWYRSVHPELAREFLDALDRCFASIRQRPEAYPLIDGTMRRSLMPRFPYGVFFEVASGQVVVFAVFHFARDPRAWKRR